jgi:CBS-domain-containing membrane protein
MSETTTFRPLAQAQISSNGCYLMGAFNPPHVTVGSPATDTMTDLSKVPSATIFAEATLEGANRSMLVRGVRLLLVVGEDNRIVGVATSADVLGEKPVLTAQRNRCHRDDLRIADVMVPVDKMEALNINDVKHAVVGDIVATLKADGRAHALVVGKSPEGQQVLLGIFSVSQIARQLGVPIHTHEVARTFAEIEAVIAGI